MGFGLQCTGPYKYLEAASSLSGLISNKRTMGIALLSTEYVQKPSQEWSFQKQINKILGNSLVGSYKFSCKRKSYIKLQW